SFPSGRRLASLRHTHVQQFADKTSRGSLPATSHRVIWPLVRVLVLVAVCLGAAVLSPTHFPLGGSMVDSRADATEANQPRGLVARDPADALAVSFERPHLVFDPEER